MFYNGPKSKCQHNQAPFRRGSSFPGFQSFIPVTFLGLQFLSPGSQPEVRSHSEWLGTQVTLSTAVLAAALLLLWKQNGTKNHDMHAQFGENMDPKYTKRPKYPTATFEEPEANQCIKSKSSVLCMSPGHTAICSVGRTFKPCLQATLDTPLTSPHLRNQAREPVVCSHSLLLQQGPQKSLT